MPCPKHSSTGSLFKIKVQYPDLDEEVKILQSHHERKGIAPQTKIEAIMTPERLQQLRQQIQEIRIEPKLLKYIAEIVTKSRNHPHLFLGGSPRASIAIMNAAKAVAAS